MRLNLALQGGGAHSAFTWGVLVRLLEADLRIEGVSGASGGALNAVVLTSGWLRGGSAGAAHALDELWGEIGALAQITPLRHGLGQLAADFAARFLSPYQLNPLGVNPLRPAPAHDRSAPPVHAARPARPRLAGSGPVAGKRSPATLDQRGSGR